MYAWKNNFAIGCRIASLVCLCALPAFHAAAQDAKPTEETSQTAAETYTSVIIDARGLGVERGMSPKIRRPDGAEIWGTKDVDSDYVLEEGIVVYCKTEEAAKKNKRCGDCPLILKAVKSQVKMQGYDLCVEAADGLTLLEADKRGHFLNVNKVIFLVDN